MPLFNFNRYFPYHMYCHSSIAAAAIWVTEAFYIILFSLHVRYMPSWVSTHTGREERRKYQFLFNCSHRNSTNLILFSFSPFSQIRPRLFSNVILDQIHIWCVAIQTQPEPSYRISCSFYIIKMWHKSILNLSRGT